MTKVEKKVRQLRWLLLITGLASIGLARINIEASFILFGIFIGMLVMPLIDRFMPQRLEYTCKNNKQHVAYISPKTYKKYKARST